MRKSELIERNESLAVILQTATRPALVGEYLKGVLKGYSIFEAREAAKDELVPALDTLKALGAQSKTLKRDFLKANPNANSADFDAFLTEFRTRVLNAITEVNAALDNLPTRAESDGTPDTVIIGGKEFAIETVLGCWTPKHLADFVLGKSSQGDLLNVMCATLNVSVPDGDSEDGYRADRALRTALSRKVTVRKNPNAQPRGRKPKEKSEAENGTVDAPSEGSDTGIDTNEEGTGTEGTE